MRRRNAARWKVRRHAQLGGDSGAGALQRREPDRHSAAHPRRSDRCVLDRESRAALVWRARAGPRVDRRNQIASAIHNARSTSSADFRGGPAGGQRVARGSGRRANRGARTRVARRAGAPQRSAHRVGACSAAAPPCAACATVARQARSIEPLLLTGPAGAGKEAVARAVHDASGRSGAFIFVSCGEVTRSIGMVKRRRAARCGRVPHRQQIRTGIGRVRIFSMRCTSCRCASGWLHLTSNENAAACLAANRGVPDGAADRLDDA